MQCDTLCSHLLIPMGYDKSKEVMHHAETLHITAYMYYFKGNTCNVYRLEKTEFASSLRNTSDNILEFKQSKQAMRISMNDILYVESNKCYVNIYTAFDKIRLRMRLSEFLEHLDASKFIRCHQSYVINMSCIYSLSRYEIMLKNGSCIPVSKAYTKNVRESYAHTYNKDLINV